MTIMSPRLSTCSQALHEGINLHAVAFMLRKVESASDVNRGSEPCQSGTALTFPILCLCLPFCLHCHCDCTGPSCLSDRVHMDMVQCGRMRMTIITLRIQNLTLFTEMITPQTYKYIYTYKTASCLSCIRGSLRLAPN